MPDPLSPVTEEELAGLFAGLAGRGPVGLACSGGPDSTAMLVLADRWSRLHGRPELHVLTVDHGLRAGSADDCAFVAELAGRLGRPCERLVWEHEDSPPTGDIQASARDARYQLLAEAARGQGIGAVALAHTRDDVAENFLMRLSRGSGLAGLAAMSAERRFLGIRFVRPLLAVTKARLVATLETTGIGWRTDPSNSQGDRFLRAKVRGALPLLAEFGLSEERLAETAGRLAEASAALDDWTAIAFRDFVTDYGGVASIERKGLSRMPEEIAFRLLVQACEIVRPIAYPPRASSLDAVIRDAASREAKRRTAGGLVFDPIGHVLWIYAEAGRDGFPDMIVDQPGTAIWDGRFRVETRSIGEPLIIRAAQRAEWRRDMPPPAAASLPVVDYSLSWGTIDEIELTPLSRQSTTSQDGAW